MENTLDVLVPPDRTHDTNIKLQNILALTSEDMSAVDHIILDKAISDVDIIPELAHHLIDSGGKRLRPMLTIASAKLAGYSGDKHISLAASVEFMHTATLLHDDVVDESNFRRGKKSARLMWGNQASVLVGDFLLGQAFRMMVDVGSLSALRILSNAAAVIAEGEVMQLAATKDLTTTENSYLAIISAKTAALFSAAAEVGAAIAERPESELTALKTYGKSLGIAFQLVDDALDYSGESRKLGKDVGDDFREGKITLAVILAYRKGNNDERAFWKRTLGEGEIRDGDLERAISIVDRHKTIDSSLERARFYGSVARNAMATFSDNKIKKAMIDVVDFCIERAS
ncbi:MAG: polyprenyl synthetase family protein [Hyphomicrobiaceae bacterium]|nr:polyprenyl synthetase family protein [Hyphomicrobiaceae bacterium]